MPKRENNLDLVKNTKRQRITEEAKSETEGILAESIQIFAQHDLFMSILQFVSETDINNLRLVCTYFNRFVLEKKYPRILKQIQQQLRVVAVGMQKSDFDILYSEKNEDLLIYRISLLLNCYCKSITPNRADEIISPHVLKAINEQFSPNQLIQKFSELYDQKKNIFKDHDGVRYLEYLNAFVDVLYKVFTGNFEEINNTIAVLVKLAKREDRYRLVYWDLLYVGYVRQKVLLIGNHISYRDISAESYSFLNEYRDGGGTKLLPEEWLLRTSLKTTIDYSSSPLYEIYVKKIYPIYLEMDINMRHLFASRLRALVVWNSNKKFDINPRIHFPKVVHSFFKENVVILEYPYFEEVMQELKKLNEAGLEKIKQNKKEIPFLRFTIKMCNAAHAMGCSFNELIDNGFLRKLIKLFNISNDKKTQAKKSKNSDLLEKEYILNYSILVKNIFDLSNDSRKDYLCCLSKSRHNAFNKNSRIKQRLEPYFNALIQYHDDDSFREVFEEIDKIRSNEEYVDPIDTAKDLYSFAVEKKYFSAASFFCVMGPAKLVDFAKKLEETYCSMVGECSEEQKKAVLAGEKIIFTKEKDGFFIYDFYRGLRKTRVRKEDISKWENNGYFQNGEQIILKPEHRSARKIALLQNSTSNWLLFTRRVNQIASLEHAKNINVLLFDAETLIDSNNKYVNNHIVLSLLVSSRVLTKYVLSKLTGKQYTVKEICQCIKEFPFCETSKIENIDLIESVAQKHGCSLLMKNKELPLLKLLKLDSVNLKIAIQRLCCVTGFVPKRLDYLMYYGADDLSSLIDFVFNLFLNAEITWKSFYKLSPISSKERPLISSLFCKPYRRDDLKTAEDAKQLQQEIEGDDEIDMPDFGGDCSI